MHKLSFWQKLAFIVNSCWLLAWVMKYYTVIPDKDMQSHVLVTGLVIAPLVNFIVNIITGILFIRNLMPKEIARWLLLTNFLFFIAQLYLYVK